MSDHGPVSPYAARLRDRRRELGLTQTELAQRAGVGQDVISRIERSEYIGAEETVQALADALSLDREMVAALADAARDPVVVALHRSTVLDDEEKADLLERYSSLLAAHAEGDAPSPKPPPVPVAVTVEQAAGMLSLGVAKVAKLLAAGELEGVSFGARSYRVTVASIEAYVARSCEDGRSSMSNAPSAD